MTAKAKKTKTKKRTKRLGKIARLHASTEDELFSLPEGKAGAARWNRPRKARICVRVDLEVLDWLKALGPGYQTRINAILRRVMERHKRKAER